ncbi:PREDICTED: myc box-dependent-interacting protein 1-like isoform X2 [Poecilia mexicana]|uniref:myc box-dependent-interacting protein 1-like isoform X2 n=1 Tax=Poecilia mexicana TaxID=48701 RepID=UPI00072D99E7|nr:PREDICTED: myc box-dependent-interacting protein 1-like isoform X2 [Poecilia mexicana]
MAELGKGVTAGKLALNVQKRLNRAQEKVLQKLGKADETRDSAFEELVANFNKQMTEGSKVQRDLKAYLAAVKAMHEASRRLQDCLADMYEPDWFGKEELDALVEDTDTLWLDYHQNLTDKSLLGLDTYLAQFPEIKARVAKRERKLVDFDSARHHFASLQKGKKKDDAKIAKPAALLEMAAPSWAQGLISAHQVAQTNLSYNQAEEELGRAQRIFEELNVELQDELPVLWDSRVGVYVGTFQSLAGHQEKFHREMSKLSHNLNDIMTKLEEQRQLKKDATAAAKKGGAKSEEANHSQASSPAPKKLGPPPSRPPPRLSPSPDPKQQIAALLEDEAAAPDSDSDPTSITQQTPSWDSWRDERGAEPLSQQDAEHEAQSGWDHSSYQSHGQPSWDNTDLAEGQDGGAAERGQAAQAFSEPDWDEGGAGEGPGGWGEEDEEESSVTNGADADLPPGFLYKVKAVHEYTATDNDELELKVGDAVLVLAFDNPEEQDDGWLLGVKESHWFLKKDISAKGVFPENFTQKV